MKSTRPAVGLRFVKFIGFTRFIGFLGVYGVSGTCSKYVPVPKMAII